MKKFYVLFTFLLFCFGAYSQIQSETYVSAAKYARLVSKNKAAELDSAQVFATIREALGLSEGFQLKLKRRRHDAKYKTTTLRYEVYFHQFRIDNSDVILHFDANKKLSSISGLWYPKLRIEDTFSVSEIVAQQVAFSRIDTNKLWTKNMAAFNEKMGQEMLETGGEAVYWVEAKVGKVLPVWKFELHLWQGNSKAIWVNASNKTVLKELDLDYNCTSNSANTLFYGSQTVWTMLSGGIYYLIDDCSNAHPFDLLTYNNMGGSGGSNTYTSSNNTWTTNDEMVGATIHYATDMFQEYLENNHGRDSWDDNNANWLSYGNTYFSAWGTASNAAWYGSYAEFGYGSNFNDPYDDWVSLDIVGHEYTHGINGSEGNLVYSYEPGALNESFADIFGEILEDYALGNNNWQIFSEVNTIRDMADPNNYGHPDTYLGNNWYTGAGDNGGVHTNSGVQNFMFYLLSEGGSGTNDNGDSYSVNGIGISNAREIAYLTLVDYVGQNTDYGDIALLWESAVQSAFPGNATYLQAVQDAWCAVGAGNNCNAVPPPNCLYYTNGTTDGDFINGVQLNTLSNWNTGYMGGPCFNDYTYLSTQITEGQSYFVDVEEGDYDGTVGVWIDFNQNGIFDGNEKMGEMIVTANNVNSLYITLPVGQGTGYRAMRVRSVYGNSNIDPVQSYSYGEIEDYTVEIMGAAVPQLPNLVSTGTSYSLSGMNLGITQYITNNGTANAGSFANYYYAYDGTNLIYLTQTNIGSLAVGGTYTDNLTLNLCNYGLVNNYSYDIYSYIDSNNQVSESDENDNGYNWLSSVYVNCVVAPAPIIAGPNHLCSGSVGTLYISNYDPNYNYYWSPSGVWNSSINVSTSGWYYVDMYDGSYNYVSSASFYVTVVPTPSVYISGNTNICSGTFTSLNANPSNGTAPYYYNWSNGATTQSISVSVAGWYDVTVFDAYGCSAWNNIYVTVNSAPTASASSNSPVCVGNTLNLAGNGVGTFYWTGPNGFTSNLQNPSIPNVSALNAGIYTLSVTQNGCSASATTNVSISVAPNASALSNSPVCVGNTLNLAGNGVGTFYWTGPNGFTSALQNPVISNASTLNAGTYTLTVTQNGCSSTASTNVSVNVSPNANASSNSPVCAGNQLALTGVGGGSYAWTGPLSFTSSLQNPTINNVTTSHSGIYILTVTAANGCTSTTNTAVTVHTSPTISAGSNSPVLAGAILNLTASGMGNSYAWTGPNNFTSFLQNPNISNVSSLYTGNYTVTTTDANGCSNSVTISVSVNSPNCSYTISPTAQNVPPVGGGFSANVAATNICPWTATTGDSWIHVLSPTGVGGQPCNYSVDTCQSGNTRTGTITITGNNGFLGTITVTQTCTSVPPTCDFFAGQTQGCAPLTVDFIDNSTTPAGLFMVEWDWSFWGSGVNIASSALQNPQVIYSLPGTYTVRLIITYNDGTTCTIIKQAIITVDNCTGIAEAEDFGVQIYPNPFSTEFTLQFAKPLTCQAEIFNTIGQLIATKAAENTDKIVFNTQNWAAGLYFIRMKTATQSHTEKILKY